MAADEDLRAVDVRVTGDVQGVFFRDSTQRRATDLGVTGWVRNESDGSVAIHAEGPRRAVDALLEWCRSGPPRADVQDVFVDEVDPDGSSSFEVR